MGYETDVGLNLLGGGKSLHGQDGAIVNGVREHGNARNNHDPMLNEQIERTVVIMGLKYLLSPAFNGDDPNEAIQPEELAQWLGERVGPVKAVHFRPPVQAWVEFMELADAKEALHILTGEVYPKKSKASPGGRIRVDVGTHRELIRGAKNHLANKTSLIPERFLINRQQQQQQQQHAMTTDPAMSSAAMAAEDPMVAAMRAANPFFEEDMRLYEAHHRRLVQAEIAEEAAEAERAEMRKRLFRGAATGDVDALEDAIWAGADSDAINPLDEGKTALHYATAAGKRAAVQALIQHGANPSAADATGTTPTMLCEAAMKMSMSSLNGDQGGRGGGADVNSGGVHRAIADDLSAAIAAHRELAILYGEVAAGRYDVNVINGGRGGGGGGGGNDQLPPLHAAIVERNGPLTRFLMAQGARVTDGAGPEGLTPLHIAARSGQTRMCRLLMLRGAAPNARATGVEGQPGGPGGVGGGTPLHEALRGVKANGAKGEHAKISKILIDDFKRLGLMHEAAAIIKGGTR